MQGIYLIKCLQEPNVYVGSSVDIKRRWIEHRYKLNRQTHHNKELQISWDAYGDESFIFEILEETEDIINREQYWLNELAGSLYNSSSYANNPQRNPDTIKKIRDTMYSKYGTRSKGGKFIESEVIDIINRINSGESPVNIAKDLKVHYSSIYYIKDGKNWKHLHHLISIPKKPKDLVFEWLEQGLNRDTIYKLLDGKHHKGTIWNWEKAYKNKNLHR